MSKEKSPAFQFYPSDFLSDSNVMLMSMEERGCYITLLSICWNNGFLPIDQAELTALCGGVNPGYRVLNCFQNNGDKLIHKRLDSERKKQREWKKKCAIGGKRSAHKRKHQKEISAEQGSCDLLASKSQVKVNSSSSISSSISNKKKSNKRKSTTPPQDYSLSPELRQWTELTSPTMAIEAEFEKFKDYEFRRPYHDWDRVWRGWVRRHAEREAEYAENRSKLHNALSQLNTEIH